MCLGRLPNLTCALCHCTYGTLSLLPAVVVARKAERPWAGTNNTRQQLCVVLARPCRPVSVRRLSVCRHRDRVEVWWQQQVSVFLETLVGVPFGPNRCHFIRCISTRPATLSKLKAYNMLLGCALWFPPYRYLLNASILPHNYHFLFVGRTFKTESVGYWFKIEFM